MAVKRIVTNVATSDPAVAHQFYHDILGLDLLMDFGWIKTFGGDGAAAPQISFASEGGSDTSVPDISVEVDNFDETLARVRVAKLAIDYGPVVEPWGVRRFYVRDPFGKLVNVLEHSAPDKA